MKKSFWLHSGVQRSGARRALPPWGRPGRNRRNLSQDFAGSPVPGWRPWAPRRPVVVAIMVPHGARASSSAPGAGPATRATRLRALTTTRVRARSLSVCSVRARWRRGHAYCVQTRGRARGNTKSAQWRLRSAPHRSGTRAPGGIAYTAAAQIGPRALGHDSSARIISNGSGRGCRRIQVRHARLWPAEPRSRGVRCAPRRAAGAGQQQQQQQRTLSAGAGAGARLARTPPPCCAPHADSGSMELRREGGRTRVGVGWGRRAEGALSRTSRTVDAPLPPRAATHTAI